MRYIKNAKIVLETGIIWDGVLAMDGDRIAAFGEASELEIPADADVIDAKGKYVGPGFVDIHVHGGNGYMFDTYPEEAAKHFLSHGETTILPTLYYNLSKEGFLESIARLKETMEQTAAGKALAGFYMEGPYMNPKYGAMPEKNKWKGDILPEMYEDVVDAAGTLAKIWAVAPEREGLEPFLKYAKKVNPDVVFSVGHSEATPEEILKLKKYGIKLQTHCNNATGRTNEGGGVRGTGPDEYCYADPEMYAEVICDSLAVHMKPATLRMVQRIKGLDRLILITDSFVSNEPIPEKFAHITDLVFDSNGGLNGSKATMDCVCRNVMKHSNYGIAQAFILASRNPARVIGMDDEIGTIEVGKKANLVIVDDMFNVDTVILEGQIWE